MDISLPLKLTINYKNSNNIQPSLKDLSNFIQKTLCFFSTIAFDLNKSLGYFFRKNIKINDHNKVKDEKIAMKIKTSNVM